MSSQPQAQPQSSEPIMTARIFKDFVDLNVDGKDRTVTVQDYVGTMAKHIGHFASTGVETSTARVLQIPRSFVGMVEREAGKRRTVFLYQESRKADLLLDASRVNMVGFIRSLINGDESKKLSLTQIKELSDRGLEYVEGKENILKFKGCMLPNIVCSLNMSLAPDKKNFVIEKVYYGFTAFPREMLRQLTKESSNLDHMCKTLGHMPFPNFYGGNTMCYGGNAVLSTVSALEENYRPLESYLALIAASPFNLDLWEGLPSGVEREAVAGQQFAQRIMGDKKVDEDRLYSLRRHYGSSYTVASWFSHLSTLTEFPYHLFER